MSIRRTDLELGGIPSTGFDEAKDILQSCNPDFPRISQIAPIATLFQTSHKAIVRFRKHDVLKGRQLSLQGG
jgi:hypothetical protein